MKRTATNPKNARLAASLSAAKRRAAALAKKSARTRFTPETARRANYIRHKAPKPATATLRVEADIPALVRCWPIGVRVAKTSAAIRAAVSAVESTAATPPETSSDVA